MSSDTESNPPEETAGPSESEAVAPPKRKAAPRKKKAAEISPGQPQETASDEGNAKPARKAARKRAKSEESEEPAPAKSAPAESFLASEPGIPEIAAPPIVESPESQEQDDIADELARQVEAEAEEEPVYTRPEKAESTETPEPKPESRPASHPERLQKILAKAGIASRRTAEEMILGGRVQVNGQVITELGTKADPARDHIRVDGKLLHGPERHRYFVLNKPKGYVTTVSDPEGRPTVMAFFAGERERLYPVGRLDYLSEGLLLVTNDGELANKLTKASSGVEKTYLVKVAGQPTEEMLDALREGVVIERGRPGTGSGRVRTAPARIRQVREGDNPWYEVTVIEGRNRELRKMFEEIGHHVEKIRRVGYGPLILDLEPGKMRELEPDELRLLNLAAEGKLKTRRRRGPAPAQLPRTAGSAVEYRKPGERPQFKRSSGPASKPGIKPVSGREPGPGIRPAPRREPEPRRELGPRREPGPRQESRPAFRRDDRPAPASGSRFQRERGAEERRPFRTERTDRPPERPAGRGGKPPFRTDRPAGSFRQRTAGERPGAPRGDRRPFSGPKKSAGAKPFSPERRPGGFTGPKRDHDDFDEKPRTGIRIEPAGPGSDRERPRREQRPPQDRRDFRERTPAREQRQDRERDQNQERPFQGRTGRPRPAGSFSPAPGARPPKKFAGARPAKFAGARPAKRASTGRPAGADSRPGARPESKAGTGGAPRKKERWRNSFTGKNKGRPKPRKPE